MKAWKKLFTMEILLAAIYAAVRHVDIPSEILGPAESRLHLAIQTNHIFYRSQPLFKCLCAVCNFFNALKIKNRYHLLCLSLFPLDISCVYNFSLLYPEVSLVGAFLISIDPLYALKSDTNAILEYVNSSEIIGAFLPQNSFLKQNAVYGYNSLDEDEWTPLGESFFEDRRWNLIPGFDSFSSFLGKLPFLKELEKLIAFPYLNGYSNNHIPALNILWPLHIAEIEQYSKLVYTLTLIVAGFITSCNRRAIPLFLNMASLESYFLYIKDSEYFDLICILSAIFEYLYFQFRNSWAVNTNFLMWVSMICCGVSSYAIYSSQKLNVK